MSQEGEAVLAAYRLRRQMIQPSWGGNERWKICWEKTAELLQQHGIDLDAYLDAQFSLKYPFPMPNHLCTAEAMQRYRLHLKNAVDPQEDIMTRVEVEMRFLETRKNLGFELEEILFFPSSPLSPLFCYCVAMAFKRYDLVGEFEEDAKMQLVRQPEAKSIYLKLLEDLDGPGS